MGRIIEIKGKVVVIKTTRAPDEDMYEMARGGSTDTVHLIVVPPETDVRVLSDDELHKIDQRRTDGC